MTAQTPTRTLQDLLDSTPNLVDHLYGNRKGSVLKDAVLRQPTQFVAPEFTNWREEQMACRTSIAFYDQSFHMTTTFLRGKDAVALMNHLTVNSYATFGVDRSRHSVVCSPDGYVVGDGILYCLAPDELALVGRQAGHNWVRFNAQSGGYDVELEEDEFMADNPNGRRVMYRYQVEGPQAPALMEQLTGAPMPQVPKLHLMHVTIAGHAVTAMQHTMAGNPGWEVFGPWDEGPAVKEAILTAGEAYDMKRVGSVAYFTTAMELGWVSRPMPAIFTHPEMKAFREWLPDTAPEATWALGGSYNAPKIEDYYFTPWELGYGNVVKFDHDFVGRAALEKTQGDTRLPHRRMTITARRSRWCGTRRTSPRSSRATCTRRSCRPATSSSHARTTPRGSTTASTTATAITSVCRSTRRSCGPSGRCAPSASSTRSMPPLAAR
jgi:vanillate/3-O-methylgallate O-demethylase